MVTSGAPTTPALSIAHRPMLLGLVGGTVAGITTHALWHGQPWLNTFVNGVTEPIGRLFLRLIFLIVLPLVFSALTLGVSGLGDLASVGRVGLKTLVVTVVISTASVGIGVLLVDLLQPGALLSEDARVGLLQTTQKVDSALAASRAPVGLEALTQMVPDNPVRAAAQGEMLAVMVFALIFGLGLARADRSTVGPLTAWLEGVYEVSMQVVGLAMKLAPLGVACLMFTLTARLGYDVLRPLGAYVAVVLLGLTVHLFVTYSLVLRLGARRSLRDFLAAVQPVAVTAFATSSSNATLPTTLAVARERLGVPHDIAGFVLTLGSTANQNGTALFEGITVLFLAQFFAVELTLSQQLLVVGMAILAGVGTAGVPGGSLPLIVPVLVAVGVPAEGIGIILGVDRFLDMCRTVLNVLGDLVVAVVVAAWEGGQPAPVGHQPHVPSAEVAGQHPSAD
ncbi:MAG: dicarboxylate/amino acid:cation symporter [Candidatus Binatia bacterium]|nr:dicarboxylate/amino acid:cation symporter [Candidatus Binatia bacterium]